MLQSNSRNGHPNRTSNRVTPVPRLHRASGSAHPEPTGQPQLTVLEMSVEAWIAIPDNPKQRDTEAHAKKIGQSLVENPSPTHCRCAAAILPDGREFKLDGHTRSYLWENGTLPRPDSVLVDYYECDTLEEVLRLYGQFDNPQCAETAPDRLAGGFRMYDVGPMQSGLMKSRLASSAFSMLKAGKALTKRFESEDIKDWVNEIRLVDAWGLPGSELITATVMAALLLTARRDGNKAKDFWKQVIDRQVVAKGREVGPTTVLVRFLESVKGAGHSGLVNIQRLESALDCYQRWFQGKMFRQQKKLIVPKGVSAAEFLPKKR